MSERTITVTDSAIAIAAMMRPPKEEMFIGLDAERLDLAANDIIKFYATLDGAPWGVLAQHLSHIEKHRKVSATKDAAASDPEKNVVEVVGRRQFDEIESQLLPLGYRARYNCRTAQVTEFRNKATGDVKSFIADPWLP